MATYIHNATDPWTWRTAGHEDVPDILDLVALNYQNEITGILTADRPRMAMHLHKAILNQIFEPHSNLVSVCRNNATNELLAWGWLERGKYTVYAPEEMSCAEFLHLDLGLSARNKITLVAQMLNIWQDWTRQMNIPVMVSTSIRTEQGAFMRLHEKLGFTLRGSFAYKRII